VLVASGDDREVTAATAMAGASSAPCHIELVEGRWWGEGGRISIYYLDSSTSTNDSATFINI
jgi:hypothetical protein